MMPIQNITFSYSTTEFVSWHLNEPMLEWGVFTLVFPMAQFSSLAFSRMAAQLSGVAAGSSLARNARMLYLNKKKRIHNAYDIYIIFHNHIFYILYINTVYKCYNNYYNVIIVFRFFILFSYCILYWLWLICTILFTAVTLQISTLWD